LKVESQSGWQFNRQVNLSVLVQLVFLAALIVGSWVNLQPSEKLQALTQLSQLQSRAFTSYYGLPRELPPAQSAEEILAQSNFQLAERALAQSAERPDAFVLADSIFELAIGICALMGGVYGTRAVGFLKDARAKSKALKEIIEGNELFKSRNSESTEDFKAAHKDQSPGTRQIVAEVKSS